MLLLSVLPACSKSDEPKAALPSPTTSAPAPAPAHELVWHCVVDPKSRVLVDLPGLTERIKADATGADGWLDIPPGDLAKTQGVVRFDLTTLTMHTFGNDKDATQTKHARTWLEVQIGDQMNESMRWAEFAIRSVDGLSASTLDPITPTQDGADDVRTLHGVAHGDLLVHGHRVPKDAAVSVSFRGPAGAAPSPRGLVVRVATDKPMRVVLKEHDVGPRDPAGKVLAWTTQLVSKVADTADVTADVVVAPEENPVVAVPREAGAPPHSDVPPMRP